MNATETAVETIYKAMGYRRCGMDHYVNHQECQRIYDPRLRRNRDGTYGGDCLRWDWPDPLADTPEGDHEFMEIVRWVESKSRVLLIMSMSEAVRKVVMQVPPKQAFIESVAELVHHYDNRAAAAIKGEQG